MVGVRSAALPFGQFGGGLPLAGPPPQRRTPPPSTTRAPSRGALKQAFPIPQRGDEDEDFEKQALIRLLEVLYGAPILGTARRVSPPRRPTIKTLPDRPVSQRILIDQGWSKAGQLPIPAGPRRVVTKEKQRAAARKRLAKIGITGALAGAVLRSSTPVPTIPEIVVTPKGRTVDLTKVRPKPTPAPSRPTTPATPPKVTIGTLRKLFPWLALPIFATLSRPRIRVQTPAGDIRDATTVSDVPLPTNVAVPLLTGLPLTQTQPVRLSSRDCQIVTRRRRRKGRCREGFFRETPTGTKYITWRSKKCR
jgi:hypothetical protein